MAGMLALETRGAEHSKAIVAALNGPAVGLGAYQALATDSQHGGNAGCGDWTVANVAGDLKINLAGSGDTTVGTAGSLAVNVGGSFAITSTTATGAYSGTFTVSVQYN